jgi:hypothetical protein
MSTEQASLRTDDCGCCAGLSAGTPAEIANRPGLSAIAYRIGTHGQFYQSLQAGLSDAGPDRAPLRDLTTRNVDDLSMSLLEAFSTMADVLTFYQERIANESYLRTCTERISTQHLGELIGYRLRPGVAASTCLAFTVETADGAPHETAVDVGVKVQSIPGPGEKPQIYETVEKILAKAAWNELSPVQVERKVPCPGDLVAYLEGTKTDLKVGDPLLIVGVKMDVKTPPFGDPVLKEQWEFRTITKIDPDEKAGRTRVEWGRRLGDNRLNPASPESPPSVYSLKSRASLFGHNAPDPKLFTADTLANFGGRIAKDSNSRPLHWLFDHPGLLVHLDRVYDRILPTVSDPVQQNSWGVLTSSDPHDVELFRIVKVIEEARSDYGLAAKATRLEIETELSKLYHFSPRVTTVYAQSTKLELAMYPRTDDIKGSTIELDREIPALENGRKVIVAGTTIAGKANAEVATIGNVSSAHVVTQLTFGEPLKEQYIRSSVRIYANVASATHGETVQETLGGGDPSRAFQKFTLLQPPLTHTSAPTETGIASSLSVRVNDVLWHEVPMLYGHGSNEHVFSSHLEDSGKTVVEFGDGTIGARLPSGIENIRARYRKGIGLAGTVKEKQLSLLLSRPLGVKGVVNPIAATGADDPEMIEDIRRNAPLTVLTLGRIVSLRDYQDFGRAFPGIAKALATWTWDGVSYGVIITVAGPGGAAVLPGSDTYKNLVGAIKAASDPHVQIAVQTYRDSRVLIAARIKTDPEHEQGKVLELAGKNLLDTFSFARRQIGQPLFLSEVITAIQGTRGVVAVDVRDFRRMGQVDPAGKLSLFDLSSGSPRTVKDGKVAYARVSHRLLARLPRVTARGAIAPAELITVDPSSLTHLTVMP